MLDWWLFSTNSSTIDRFASSIAEESDFQEAAAVIAARLSARQPAPLPWLSPPQWLGGGKKPRMINQMGGSPLRGGGNR